MKTQDILAPEILANMMTRPLKVGMLATFRTYNGKQIGCRIVRMWAAGEISNTAQIEVRIIDTVAGYCAGQLFTIEADRVQEAV